jgi:hypothetical protein
VAPVGLQLQDDSSESVGRVKRAKPRFGGAPRRSLECSNHSRAVMAARAAPPELESASLVPPPYGLRTVGVFTPQAVTVSKKALSDAMSERALRG